MMSAHSSYILAIVTVVDGKSIFFITITADERWINHTDERVYNHLVVLLHRNA